MGSRSKENNLPFFQKPQEEPGDGAKLLYEQILPKFKDFLNMWHRYDQIKMEMGSFHMESPCLCNETKRNENKLEMLSLNKN